MLLPYLLAVVFAIAGVALGVVNAWNNALAINGGSFDWNDLTMLVAGLAATSALLSLGLGLVARRSLVVTALCIVTIAGCTYVSVGYTLGRVGGVADQKASGALGHNAKLALYQHEVDSLTAKRDAEEANGGCGRRCRKIEERLQAARLALAAIGPRQVVDPAGERLEALFGAFMPAKMFRDTHPVVTAATLELGTALLLTLAGLFAAPVTRRPNVVHAEIVEPPADPLIRALQVHGTVSGRKLAQLTGKSEATISRQVKQLRRDGLVAVERQGRRKAITLA